MGRTAKQLESALRAKDGNVTEAAKALGMTYRGLQKRIAGNAALQAVVEEFRAGIVDLAESQLRKAINKGNVTAMIFTLKANPEARKRGWRETSHNEVTGADDGPIEIDDTARSARIAALLNAARARRDRPAVDDGSGNLETVTGAAE